MKKIKSNILYLGLSFKVELRNFIFLNIFVLLLGVATTILTKSILYLFTVIPVMLIVSFFYVSRYSTKISKQNQKNVEEFTNLFSYFKIYLHNGYNVYSALKELKSFANNSLKKMLEDLLNEIDSDKSVKPFINFAKQFDETIIEEMMISIYQMIDDGENGDNLIHYELIFDKFSELMYQKSMKKKDSKLATLSSAPLIGSCYLMLVLTIGIVSVIGVMINGI